MKHVIIAVIMIAFPCNISLALTAYADSNRTIQDSSRLAKTSSTLSVVSNVIGTKVFIDTVLIGQTPMREAVIDSGRHVLRYVHPRENDWLLPAIVETLTIGFADHIERTVNFPIIYHITSEPYGASVHYRDSLIGQTPFIFKTSSDKGLITLTKEGYDEIILPLQEEGGTVHAVLISRTGIGPSDLVGSEQMKSLTPVYVASGAAVISGVVAAYCKIKADGYYNDYRNTGDPAALERVRSLDTASSIAFVTSQVSLLMLSYLLLSR